jgi:hypothetical protein
MGGQVGWLLPSFGGLEGGGLLTVYIICLAIRQQAGAQSGVQECVGGVRASVSDVF